MKIKNSFTIFLVTVSCMQAYYINHLKDERIEENSSEFTYLHTKKYKAGFSLFGRNVESPLGDTIGGTLPISSVIADSARALYRDHPNHLTVFDGTSKETLEGFIMRKDRIQLLFDESEYLYFALGIVPGEFQHHDSVKNFTLYVYGMDSTHAIIKKRGKAQVYEYLTPCPKQCPKY